MNKIVIVIMVVILTGCATYSFVKTGTSPAFPPKSPDCQIDVLTRMPDRPAVEVGLCHGQAPGGGAFIDNTPDAVEQVKRCACANGGDAVVLLHTGESSSIMSIAGPAQQQVRIVGQVIRYNE